MVKVRTKLEKNQKDYYIDILHAFMDYVKNIQIFIMPFF